MIDIGSRIYSLRTKMGLSQQQLADRLGVSRQSVSKWETGTALPELDKLVAMSELFGVTLDEMAGKVTTATEQSTPLSQMRVFGIVLMAVCLINVPLFAAFIPERIIWFLVLPPMFVLALVWMFAKENLLYKSVMILLWPLDVILVWGFVFMYAGATAYLSRPIMIGIVFAAVKLFDKNKVDKVSVAKTVVIWLLYGALCVINYHVFMWLAVGSGFDMMFISMFFLGEPIMLALAAYGCKKTIKR